MRSRKSLSLALLLFGLGTATACDGRRGKSDVEEHAASSATPSRPSPAGSDTGQGAGTHAGERAGGDHLGMEPPRASPEALRDARKRFLEMLNEGRSLTKAGDYAAGMAKYRQALEIDPADPSALAEMGWAAFKAGEFDVAQEHTVRALRFAKDDAQLGMMHYNLGRIAEARDDDERAIDAYRRSLELRDNETVKKRLAALTSDGANAHAGSLRGLATLAEKLQGLEQACQVLEEKICKEEYGVGDEPCGCEPKLLAGAPDGDWGLLKLTVRPAGAEVGFYPAVKTSAGWSLFDIVAYEYNPGAFGIFEETEVTYQGVEQPLADGSDALVLQIEKGRVDRDMGLEEAEFESSAVTVVCTRVGATARCTPPLVRRYRYTREVETYGETPDPDIDHEGLPIEQAWDVTLGMRNGVLTVTGEDTAEAALRGETRRLVVLGEMLGNGTYELVELMAR